MYYKTNWQWRLNKEIQNHRNSHPEYKVVVSSSERSKKYSNEEIVELLNLKRQGIIDQEIANRLDRTYWSVVAKLSELRKDGHL